MDTKYSRRLICVSCGHDSYLESNYDESYIMCMYCHREYNGGIYELLDLNSQTKNQENTQVDQEIKNEARQNFSEPFKMN